MQSCMAKAGFDFVVLSLDDVQEIQVMAATSEEVQQFGYNLLPNADVKPVTETDQAAMSDPAFQNALTGNPDVEGDGCKGSAHDVVYEDEFWEIDAIVEVAKVDASIGAESTSGQVSLDLEWSACMRTSGFDYEKPGDPLSEFASQPLSPAQVATRVADLNCQADVSYSRTVSEIENSVAVTWIEANPGIVEKAIPARVAYLSRLEDYAATLT